MHKLLTILRYIIAHPLGRRHKIKAISRFISWQLSHYLNSGEKSVSFFNGAKMIVKKNDTGVTGNIYVGIHDFYELSFALHFLDEKDIFVDVGANVGFYSIILAKSKNVNSIAFEPIPSTYFKLEKNIKINSLSNNVFTKNIAVGSSIGKLKMSSDLDTVNHVRLTESDSNADIIVEVCDLDTIFSSGEFPSLVKIDVEGFETEVIGGMKNFLLSDSLKAIIIELNGSGGRYGYDESLIHQTLLSHSFKPFHYDPFQRKLTTLNSYGSNNTLYLRDLDFIFNRVNKAPKFEVFGEFI
jgi:FkbM family methyltransferase